MISLIPILGTLALIGYGVYQNAIKLADNVRVYARLGGIPRISKGFLELPLVLTIDNPEPAGFTVQDVFVTAYRKEGTGWKYIGSTKPGTTNLQIKPSASSNLQIPVRIPILDAVSTLVSAFQTGLQPGNYKAAGHMTIDGVKVNFDSTQLRQ